MLHDRYEIDRFFLDIATQASEMEPVLVQIDRLLDDEAPYQIMKNQMAKAAMSWR